MFYNNHKWLKIVFNKLLSHLLQTMVKVVLSTLILVQCSLFNLDNLKTKIISKIKQSLNISNEVKLLLILGLR